MTETNNSTERENQLKKILENYGSNVTRRFTEDAVISAVKKWLEQKLEDEKEKAFPETVVLHELIEELSSN